jgi:hypothetical protein
MTCRSNALTLRPRECPRLRISVGDRELGGHCSAAAWRDTDSVLAGDPAALRTPHQEPRGVDTDPPSQGHFDPQLRGSVDGARPQSYFAPIAACGRDLSTSGLQSIIPAANS